MEDLKLIKEIVIPSPPTKWTLEYKKPKYDSKGIKISGSRKTDLGVVGLCSPIIRFDSVVINSMDEEIMIGDLAETAFVKIQLEIWSFIFAGKRGGEFNFPEAEKPVSGLNITKLEKVG